MKHAFPEHRVQQVREMRLAGASLEDIRATLGFSPKVLQRLLREHDIPRHADPEAVAHAKRGYRMYLRRA
jgi:hypothetical protein